MIYIHIGQHKAGSTTIQRFFWSNRVSLATAGVVYPSIGVTGCGHHALQHWALSAARGGMTSLEPLEKLVGRNADVSFFFSSETLELLPIPAVTALVRATQPHELRVLVFLRPFPALMPSLYAQQTKSGCNVKDFDGFFETRKRLGTLSRFNAVARWAAVIGWNALRVRLVERSVQGSPGLLGDVLDAIGLDRGFLNENSLGGTSDANVSQHWISIEAMRALASSDGGNFITKRRAGRELSGERRAQREERWAAQFVAACANACSALGLDRLPGQYLTPLQHTLLTERWIKERERFSAVGIELPPVSLQSIEERRFLPSIEVLSVEEREDIGACLAMSPNISHWPKNMRRLAVSVVTGSERSTKLWRSRGFPLLSSMNWMKGLRRRPR